MEFKYLVKGENVAVKQFFGLPVLSPINRKCLTLDEAENVKEGLEAVGYKIEILEIDEEG